MSEIAQLKQQLKSLKLSGALETIELRIMESGQNQLSFAELLSLMLEDEILTRQNRKLQRLLTHARLNSNKSIETFDFTFNSSINAQQIRTFITCRFVEKNENIFFVGPTGTGKTHLSKAIGHAACRKYLSVGFFNFHDLFLSLHQADLNNKLDKQLKSIIK
ncbi:MAG: ATP-binding protein, partial [Bacteroidetes bacterium]|nr:ATP-binding protein [Bacteroidota bacterium]